MAQSNADLIDIFVEREPDFNRRFNIADLLKTILPEGLAGKRIAFGTASFTTTGVTKEVSAYTAEGKLITTIQFAICMPKAAWAATELMYMDGVVDGSAGSETTTVTRIAGTTTGLGFWYFFIGI